jgi:hypothetical protein
MAFHRLKLINSIYSRLFPQYGSSAHISHGCPEPWRFNVLEEGSNLSVGARLFLQPSSCFLLPSLILAQAAGLMIGNLQNMSTIDISRLGDRLVPSIFPCFLLPPTTSRVLAGLQLCISKYRLSRLQHRENQSEPSRSFL